MELVEVDPVAFLLPDGMTKVPKVIGREGIRGYWESEEQVESVPGGILVKVEDGSGDLADRVEERTSGFDKLAKIEDLTDEDVPWPGIGPATELRYTAKPYMLVGAALRTVDRMVVVDDRTVTVSISAPPELWERLGLDTVVESLRSAR